MFEEYGMLSSGESHIHFIAGGLDPFDRPMTVVQFDEGSRARSWFVLLPNINKVALFDQCNLETGEERRIIAVKPELIQVLRDYGLEFEILEEID